MDYDLKMLIKERDELETAAKCKPPPLWKIARITPIFKEGDRDCKEICRHFSVLPVVARLFEKLTFNQLYKYLNKNNLLYGGQTANRKLYSTATCLIKNTDKINGTRQ